MSGNYPAITETSLVRIIQSIRDLYQGRSNATGVFTLDVSPATETVVAAANCGPSSIITLMPRTANAAGAIATTYIEEGNVGSGTFTVTHDATANNDETFSYSIQG